MTKRFVRVLAVAAIATGAALPAGVHAALACDASWEALGDLLATPAPGLAEVVQKIELASEYGRRIDDLEPVIADLRRLDAGRA